MESCFRGSCGATIYSQRFDDDQYVNCDYGRGMHCDLLSYPEELCAGCQMNKDNRNYFLSNEIKEDFDGLGYHF